MKTWLASYPRHKAAETLKEGFMWGVFPSFTLIGRWSPPTICIRRSLTPRYSVEKVRKDVKLGHIAGPFEFSPFFNLKISPLVVVHKKELGKFHLIHHLSYPKGRSVNDSIRKEDVSVSYVFFDRVGGTIGEVRLIFRGKRE